MNFIPFLFLVLALGAVTTAIECSSSQGSSVEFDLATWRNASGHRNVKNNLYFAETQNKNTTANWDVKISTAIVRGIRLVHVSSSVSIPDQRKGPAGYELAPGIGWYRLHLQPLTWEQAKAACEEEGAHLAVLNSQQEADVLKAIFARAPDTIPNASYNHVAHIGYTDIVEGQYITIFGETLKSSGYSIWGANQPNNVGGDRGDKDSDCGGIERTGKLNDLPCKSLCAYFCEYPL